MSTFKPSIYQQAIYTTITDEDCNIVVQAVAGSGKTTTIVNALNLIPKNKTISFMAFNRSIVGELKEKVDKRVMVTTLHSFGAKAVSSRFNSKVDAMKYQKLLNGIYSMLDGDMSIINMFNYNKSDIALFPNFIIDEQFKENETSYKNNILKLTDLGRINFVDINNKSKSITNLKSIADKFGIELYNGEIEKAFDLITIGSKITDIIDFTDQLYLPNLYNIETPKFDFVFIDECQDLNTCQRMLMLKAMKPNGRFIAVGDKNQAIYGFAGADYDSYDTLAGLPNTKVLPLSCSYRCGKNIIKLAQKIVPQIEAFEGAIDGEVDYRGKINDIESGDMVLCRCVFPLVKLCMKFLSQGIKAKLMGSDISAQLANLVKNQERKREEFTTQNVITRLDIERKKILDKLMVKNRITEDMAKKTSIYTTFVEKIMVIKEIAGSETDANKVIDKIKMIFSDDDSSDGIILSTAHKSKGLEADRVFLINPDKMPLTFPNMQDWQIEQESNLEYVAITRAKSLLSYIPTSEFDAYDDSEVIVNSKLQKDLKESKHVGTIGEKFAVRGTLIEVVEKLTPHGDCNVYTIIDEDGNIFEKWGVVNEKFITEGDELKEGCKLAFNAIIKAHREYKNEKKNIISVLSSIDK